MIRVRVPAGFIVFCSWARHFTLTVLLSAQVYKWLLHTGGSSNTSGRHMLRKLEVNAGRMRRYKAGRTKTCARNYLKLWRFFFFEIGYLNEFKWIQSGSPLPSILGTINIDSANHFASLFFRGFFSGTTSFTRVLSSTFFHCFLRLFSKCFSFYEMSCLILRSGAQVIEYMSQVHVVPRFRFSVKSCCFYFPYWSTN